MLSLAVLNKIQLFFFILASFLVKKIMRLNFERRKTVFSSNHAVLVLSFFFLRLPALKCRLFHLFSRLNSSKSCDRLTSRLTQLGFGRLC